MTKRIRCSPFYRAIFVLSFWTISIMWLGPFSCRRSNHRENGVCWISLMSSRPMLDNRDSLIAGEVTFDSICLTLSYRTVMMEPKSCTFAGSRKFWEIKVIPYVDFSIFIAACAGMGFWWIWDQKNCYRDLRNYLFSYLNLKPHSKLSSKKTFWFSYLFFLY